MRHDVTETFYRIFFSEPMDAGLVTAPSTWTIAGQPLIAWSYEDPSRAIAYTTAPAESDFVWIFPSTTEIQPAGGGQTSAAEGLTT